MSRSLRGAAAAIALVLGACIDSTAPAPAPRTDIVASRPNYLVCPTGTTTSTSGLVTPLGGTIALGATSIAIPEGALLEPTTITVTIPASQYVQVNITANGTHGLLFLVPATVTIDYSRCPASAIPGTPLSAWYVNDSTSAPLQYMGGTDLRLLQQVVFTTGHLSGYAIAQ